MTEAGHCRVTQCHRAGPCPGISLTASSHSQQLWLDRCLLVRTLGHRPCSQSCAWAQLSEGQGSQVTPWGGCGSGSSSGDCQTAWVRLMETGATGESRPHPAPLGSGGNSRLCREAGRVSGFQCRGRPSGCAEGPAGGVLWSSPVPGGQWSPGTCDELTNAPLSGLHWPEGPLLPWRALPSPTGVQSSSGPQSTAHPPGSRLKLMLQRTLVAWPQFTREKGRGAAGPR